MTALEQAAHDLVSRHLAGRVLADRVRIAIEQAVTEQLREGFTPEMDAALQQLIKTYAEGGPTSTPEPDGQRGDDYPPTITDVHWTSNNN